MKKKSNNLFQKMAMLIFCVFCFISLVILQLEKNDLQGEAAQLNAQVAELEDYVSELQATLDEPFNDEYVAEIAKTKLGLRHPQEVIFYSSENSD